MPSERTSYFVVVDAKSPVTVPLEASSPDEERARGEEHARYVIARFTKTSTAREAAQYVAVRVTEARPREKAEA